MRKFYPAIQIKALKCYLSVYLFRKKEKLISRRYKREQEIQTSKLLNADDLFHSLFGPPSCVLVFAAFLAVSKLILDVRGRI